jgi:hypothetical protein
LKKKKKLRVILALETLKANADEMTEKEEKLFHKCVLELHFTTIISLGEPSF